MLTSAGFKRKRYVDYFEEMSEHARELFGEDVNLSERSALGKFLSIIAYNRAEDAELAEQVYHSRSVETSEGVVLDANVRRALITRRDWINATGSVRATLSGGVTVEAGTLLATPYGVQFETTEAFTAPMPGTYTIPVQAVEPGQIGNVDAGDITVIVNPVVGFDAVTNLVPFTNGQDRETDEELRARYYESLGKAGNRRGESVRSRILDEVDGVRAALVFENVMMTEDEEGRPPKSFETVVLGGNPQDIARKIFDSKPAGILAHGSEQVQVTDSQGATHTVGFSLAESVEVYVRAEVRKGLDYPSDGDERVKEEVVRYIGGTGAEGVHDGLSMNQDVVLARLEAQLFRVPGVEDVRVSLSTDGTDFTEANIDIASKQVAETDTAKVEVVGLV